MKNLTARELSLVLVFCLGATTLCADKKQTGPDQKSGFTSLFDGKTLKGWLVMNQGQFSVKSGVIFLNGGSGWLRSDKEYQDFELRMDFRFLHKGANSGIFFRASKEGSNYPAKNYQVQTMDHPSIGSIYSAGRVAPKEKKDADLVKKTLKKPGEWQSYAITVQGGKVEVRLNDRLITVADGLAFTPGYIGIQGEGGQLEIKNIRIKELKSKGKTR
jgi:hypothetical protein